MTAVLQDYHEVKIILRVPRTQQSAGAACTAESTCSRDGSLPETAVGVNGIELREQTHEEALLSTIGAVLSCTWAPCFIRRPLHVFTCT